MTKETQVKLQELLANPKFYRDLRGCAEAEAALAYFSNQGLAIDESNALTIWNTVRADKFAGELSDEDLDKVAAGNCYGVVGGLIANGARVNFGLCLS